MSAFTLPAIKAIRGALRSRWKMTALCAALQNWTRDEIVEAIDATRRYADDETALWHVNGVLSLQALGVPLVNGFPADQVMRPWTDAHPAPQT